MELTFTVAVTVATFRPFDTAHARQAWVHVVVPDTGDDSLDAHNALLAAHALVTSWPGVVQVFSLDVVSAF